MFAIYDYSLYETNSIVNVKLNKNIEILEGKYIPQNINTFNKKKNYLMFCGIGNPKEFENTLLKHKFKLNSMH